MKIIFLQDILFDYFGPMYISAMLKQAGHKVELHVPENKKYINKIKDADMIALSCMSAGHQWYLRRAKEIKSVLDIPILLGGPHATFFPEVINDMAIDYICVGEGESATLDLVNSLETGKDILNIQNIWTKHNKTSLRPLADINLLPFPDRELYYKYSLLRNLPTKRFMTSRGCPYKCTFCYNAKIQELYHNKGRFVRQLTPENAVSEIQQVRNKYKLKQVRFADDTLAMNKKWFKSFMKLYKQEIDLPFTFLLRANELDDESIALAKSAGCRYAYFGIESGSERVRNKILNKQISDNDIYRISASLRNHRIKFGTYNILGIPTETLDDAFSTIKMNIKIKTDTPQCTILQPYPRTRLFDYCMENGLLDNNFNPDDLSTMFDNSVLKLDNINELQNLQKLFYLAVKFPILFPILKKMVKLPNNLLFKLIMFLSYAHRSFKSFDVGFVNAVRLGLHVRKTIFK